MKTLLSKVQYRQFEPGEFVEVAERTLEGTLAFVQAYPWEQERDALQVALTNPSITIEGISGEFLKCALYYKGRFVLYYFDRGNELFKRSIGDIGEALPFIEAFFRGGVFELSGLRKERS